MRIRVDNVGQIGVVRDIPSHELPPNAWSDADNVRMQDGAAKKANGYSALWTDPEVAPYFLMPVQTPPAFYWVYAGLNKVYAIQNKFHFDITRTSGDYSANVFWRWNGGNLGGVIVLNNTVDVPQFWSFPTSHANPLQDLTGWSVNDRCKVIRPYKNYLVAVNVDKSGTTFSTMVKWSHSADIGAVPSSWDITDPTLDAGETSLPQVGGAILDQRVLRDSNIIYRTDSTWAMQFIGGNNIFRFWELFATSGILSVDCVQEFFGSHIVFTQDDVIVHDGQNIRSVATNLVRRHIFSDISSSNYDRSYLVHNRTDKEVWVCYPTTNATLPDRAWVWNYTENTWAPRDIPDPAHIAWGVADESAVDAWEIALGSWRSQSSTWALNSSTWSTDDIAWSADDKPWDYRTYNAQLLNLVYADPTLTKLWRGDDTNQAKSATLSVRLEREGLALVGPGKTDITVRKYVRAIYPHFQGTNGAIINISVGTKDTPDQTTTWGTAKSFTIGTDYKADFQADGRLIGVKYESTGDDEWQLDAYEMEIEVTGER